MVCPPDEDVPITNAVVSCKDTKYNTIGRSADGTVENPDNGNVLITGVFCNDANVDAEKLRTDCGSKETIINVAIQDDDEDKSFDFDAYCRPFLGEDNEEYSEPDEEYDTYEDSDGESCETSDEPIQKKAKTFGTYSEFQSKAQTKVYEDKVEFSNRVTTSTVELVQLKDMIRRMVKMLMPFGLEEVLRMLGNKPLHIATMCSGTEAPILFLREVNAVLEEFGWEELLQYNHVFSAEIVDWKQHYILANFGDVPIFRDIVEFSNAGSGRLQATTIWGAKIDVPMCDFLIAGFCCVDFSTLNSKKRSIEDGGESGDTLCSIIDYAKKCRPKLILLENVQKAPWFDKPEGRGKRKPGLSITQRFDDIGYAVQHIRTDTKQYYIPHTRVRGYMLCADKGLYCSIDIVTERLTNWKEFMIELKAPASAPVEALLLKADDPVVRAALLERSVRTSSKVINWTKCRVGHELYRTELGLGEKRPLTHWTQNGTPMNPDFHLPLPERTDRVSDTMDIAHLRNVRRGADDRYLNRNLDLSQNVYREHDKGKMGTIGCYTPHGIPFSTARGAKIIGREGLILQGLPVEQIELEQLSNAQMQDLAGNAMSTTVVGPAILAALIVFRDVLEPGIDRPVVNKPTLVPNMVGECALIKKVVDSINSPRPLLADILLKASASSRLCYCEGRQDKLSITFRRCQECGHTACIGCGQSPRHNYVAIDDFVIRERVEPAAFEAYIKQALPMKVSFESSFDLDFCIGRFCDAYRGEMERDMRAPMNLIRKALTTDVCYHFCRRRETWQVEYLSRYSKLLLTITPFGMEWLLFVTVPSDMSCMSAVRRYFEAFPLAKMVPNGDVITNGTWEFWIPEARHFRAKIISKGSVVPSFKAQRGLQGAAGQYVHSISEIRIEENGEFENLVGQEVCGEYVLHQSCGQAFDSFHKKVARNKAASGKFFYLEHTGQFGDPKEHGFILTNDIRRLDYGERRLVYAHVPKYRQPIVGEHSKDHTEDVTVVVDGIWVRFDGFGITPSRGVVGRFCHLPSIPSFEPKCRVQLTAFSCQISLANINLIGPDDRWVEIRRANEVAFFAQVAWALEGGKVMEGHDSKKLQDMKKWSTIRCKFQECDICTPKTPKLMWAYETVVKGNRNPRQIAFEDPQTASRFENALKTRPPGISVLYRISRGQLHLRIGINPTTLCHRALAGLKPSGPTNTSWCFVTNDSSPRARCLPFELRSSEEEAPAEQPDGFVEDFALRPEQQRTLAWMLRQEQGVCFSEREFVEERNTHMGYLLMAQAWQDRLIRGGILASEVGFGKTIMILALILSRRKADEDFVANYTGKLIPSKATVVFVPAQLPKQWKSEAERFMSKRLPRGSIIAIETITQLKALTIGDIQKAVLIIVSCSLPQRDSYQLRLATLTGMVEPADNATPRVKAVWHQTAREQIEQAMEVLRAYPSQFQLHLNETLSDNIIDATGIQLPIPSKRLTGAAYLKANKKRTHCEMVAPKQAASNKVEHKNVEFRNGVSTDHVNLKGPVLEQFHFARKVVDEFCYLIGDENSTIMSLAANSSWALSGTAPVDTYAGIKATAAFIGVYVGPDDFSRMLKVEKDKAKKEMTQSEKVLTFQGVSSGHLVELRFKQAREFCNVFVRRDLPQIAPIASVEHFHLVHQPATEAIAYLELEQRLLMTDFEVRANHASGSDAESQISDVLGKALDPREALLVRASQYTAHDNVFDTSAQTESGTNVAKMILAFRELQRHRPMTELHKLFDIAIWFVNDLGDENRSASRFRQALKQIQQNSLGDLEVTQAICGLVNNSTEKYDPENSDNFTARPCMDANREDGFKMIVKDILKSVHELLHRYQSHRFYDRFLAVLDLRNCCDMCHKTLDSSRLVEFRLLSTCGHLICMACLACSAGQCPYQGCSGPCGDAYQVMASRVFGERNGEYYPFGEKFRHVIDLIKSIDDEDQVLVFVPTHALHTTATQALKHSQIPFTELKSGLMASNKLQNFQLTKSTKTKKRSKVLLLDIGDASAAGSNLTMANHVIFLAPYLTLGPCAQKKYDEARKQAEGRVKRFGQMKTVHIYNFVTSRTVDADIYELREKKAILSIGNETLLADAEPGQHGDFCSRIGNRIFEVEDNDVI